MPCAERARRWGVTWHPYTGSTRRWGVTWHPCAEKRAKLRSHLTHLRLKARVSPDALKGASYQPSDFAGLLRQLFTPLQWCSTRSYSIVSCSYYSRYIVTDRGIGFLDKFKETREEAPRPVQEPSSCLKIVKCGDDVCSLKNYVCTRSSFLFTQSPTPLAPPWATGPTAQRVIAAKRCVSQSAWEAIPRISRGCSA